MAYAYSLAAWVDAHTALLDLIKAGTGAALARFYDADDVLLAEATLNKTSSAVSLSTGDITLVVETQEDAAVAGGTADTLRIVNGDGDVVVSFPCKAGSAAEAGWCVMSTLNVIIGAPVEISSLAIPAGATL